MKRDWLSRNGGGASKQERAVQDCLAKLRGEGVSIRTDRLWHTSGDLVRLVVTFPDLDTGQFVTLIDKDGKSL